MVKIGRVGLDELVKNWTSW